MAAVGEPSDAGGVGGAAPGRARRASASATAGNVRQPGGAPPSAGSGIPPASTDASSSWNGPRPGPAAPAEHGAAAVERDARGRRRRRCRSARTWRPPLPNVGSAAPLASRRATTAYASPSPALPAAVTRPSASTATSLKRPAVLPSGAAPTGLSRAQHRRRAAETRASAGLVWPAAERPAGEHDRAAGVDGHRLRPRVGADARCRGRRPARTSRRGRRRTNRATKKTSCGMPGERVPAGDEHGAGRRPRAPRSPRRRCCRSARPRRGTPFAVEAVQDRDHRRASSRRC